MGDKRGRFQDLLRQLQEEHDGSLLRLRQELSSLRKAATKEENDDLQHSFLSIPSDENQLNDFTDLSHPVMTLPDFPPPDSSRVSFNNHQNGMSNKLSSPAEAKQRRSEAWQVSETATLTSAVDDRIVKHWTKTSDNVTSLIKSIKKKKTVQGSRIALEPPRRRRSSKNERTTEADISFQRAWTQMMRKVDNFMDQWEQLDEPDPSHRFVGRVVTSYSFSVLCFFVILFDTIVTARSLDYTMSSGRETLPESFNVINICILIFYCLEMVLKVSAFQKFFFIGSDMKWNWLDLVLVLQAILNIFLERVLNLEGQNLTFIRFLRLMKLAKIFRLVRALKFLRELRVMLMSIASSLSALFWAFVTLGLVLYIFSLIFVQAMSGYIIDYRHEIDATHRELIIKYFGSVTSSLLTLYQSSSSGIDWYEIYDLIKLSGAFYAMAFIFFIGFFNFAVLNILTGIFMEKALVAAAPDRESQALEQRRKDEEYASELLHVLQEMDENNSGTISYEEFTNKTRDGYVQAYFKTLGLNILDAAMFFSVCSKYSGKVEVPIEEFVWRCVRMKGAATSLDLQSVACEVSVIHDELLHISRAIGVNNKDIDFSTDAD